MWNAWGEKESNRTSFFSVFFSVEVFSLRSWLWFFLSSVFIQIRNKGFYYRLSLLLRPSGKVFCVIWAYWIKIPQCMKGRASFFPLFWCPLIPNGSLITPEYCQWLCYWDALLLVECKVSKGKGLFVRRHHLVNTSCQLWDSDGALWLFEVGQTSVWACQNWFCKESHNSGTERKTMGL